MKTVGIRDLKSKLSLYMGFVKAGETIMVTEHNRVIAEISLPRHKNELIDSKLEAYIKKGVGEGKIIPAKYTTSRVNTIEVDQSLDWENELIDIRQDRF